MIPYRIRCEAVAVGTETGICPGGARTEQGEVYVIDGRTHLTCPHGVVKFHLTRLS